MPKRTIPKFYFLFFLCICIFLYEIFFFNIKKQVALANNTIRVSAVVLGRPVIPKIALKEVCFSENGTLATTLAWPQDINSANYTLTKNGIFLADHITKNQYVDKNTIFEEASVYTVTAHGISGDVSATSKPISVNLNKSCLNSNPSALFSLNCNANFSKHHEYAQEYLLSTLFKNDIPENFFKIPCIDILASK